MKRKQYTHETDRNDELKGKQKKIKANEKEKRRNV